VAENPSAPAAPFDIELPACFYLGREYDLDQKTIQSEKYVMYDARDLTTHGVIVGMTGSGKTGLSIAILEEAAIDGIPCIIIDPKGDLTNLLLQFPDLDPKKFEKWVNPDDAQLKKQTVPEYAAQMSARWRKGLEETAQTPDRIMRLRASSDYRIYTPGSEAGLPLSILGSFAAPKDKMPLEALTQKIDATATALLGLSGITSDPIQSREHILIAQLLLHSWKAKKDLDLTGLIQMIQNPPIRTVGAYNLETFFPAKERTKFASLLNNVLAAPSFATWTMGEPLDLSSMLYRAGRPQQLIFYVAHLDDTQRMFFTTLLLEEVLSWTRKQQGTSNLRALLYFDEVYGYLPPHPANPPSKQPLLTLLKQARAFGVGVLLATQNPVDLDYKALSNAGTWFVGKLQTERDKARLLEGLESVAAEHGTLTDRGYLERVIASLGNRIFLLHDIHRQKPLLFQTRWALSFLRGPMNREQVSLLMEPLKTSAPMAIPLCSSCHAELNAEVGDRCPGCGKMPWANSAFRLQDKAFRDKLQMKSSAAIPALRAAAATSVHPPVLPPDINQFFLPIKTPQAGMEIEYQPMVLGFAEVAFVLDKRKGVEYPLPIRLIASAPGSGIPVAWDRAEAVNGQLDSKATAAVRWGNVPETLDTGRKIKALEKAFGEYLYSTQKLSLFENRTLELVSEPGESLAKFQERCRAGAALSAEQAVEMEKVKFKPKFEALDASLPADPAPVQQSSGGLIGWLFGSSSSKPAASSSASEEPKVRKLTADYQAKKAEIMERWKRVGEEATPIQVKPRKVDVRVTHFGIAWVPYVRQKDAAGNVQAVPAWR